MDPNANIARQRELAAAIIEAIDGKPDSDLVGFLDLSKHDELMADINEDIATLANELAELVQALDEWRLKGGFDPYLTQLEVT